MTDAEKRIREALAAGPTPGPWYLRTNRHPTTDGRAWGWLDTQPPGGSQCAPPGLQITWERGSKSATNAAYIAACYPEAIRELLAERDALKVENEKLLALERDVLSTLPGVYYMDPPDGGSAPLGEQVRRMAVDAARYRWLRGEHKRVDPICAVIWKRNGDRNGSEWVNTANIDAEIDAAMEASNEN